MPCARFHWHSKDTRVQEGREARGLSQLDLAKRLEVDRARVVAWEKGSRPSSGELVALSEALGLPIAFFVRPRTVEDVEDVRGHICGEGVVACTVGDCGMVADWLCDWPMGEGKTCDLPLCDRHRVHQGGDLEGIDYCPQHAWVALGMVTAPETRPS